MMPAPVQARDFVVAYEGDPDTLDLLSARHGPTAVPVSINIVEYLLDTTPAGDLIPGLVTKWELSPDKRVLTMTLRKGVKFHPRCEWAGNFCKEGEYVLVQSEAGQLVACPRSEELLTLDAFQ